MWLQTFLSMLDHQNPEMYQVPLEQSCPQNEDIFSSTAVSTFLSFLINMVGSSVNSYFRSTSSTEVSWYLLLVKHFNVVWFRSLPDNPTVRASLRNQYLSRSLFADQSLNFRQTWWDLVNYSSLQDYLARDTGKLTVGHFIVSPMSMEKTFARYTLESLDLNVKSFRSERGGKESQSSSRLQWRNQIRRWLHWEKILSTTSQPLSAHSHTVVATFWG